MAYSKLPDAGEAATVNLSGENVSDLEAQEPLTENTEYRTYEFEIEEPVWQSDGTSSKFRRYRKHLQNYQYSGFPRYLLYVWYVVNFFSIMIVLDFSKTPFSNFTIRNHESGRSWYDTASDNIKSLEVIAPGSTQNISYPLLLNLPNASDTYYIYHFGLCKEDELLERTCYRGLGAAKLIAKDLALQVADVKGVKDRKKFEQDWDKGYHSALEKATAVINRNTHCTKRSLWALFTRKCVTKNLDDVALRDVQHLSAFSKASFSTKLWMAALVFFIGLTICDAYSVLVTANVDTLRVPWRWLFLGNLLFGWAYFFCSMFELSDPNAIMKRSHSKSGSLWMIVFGTLLLQTISGIVIGTEWDMKRLAAMKKPEEGTQEVTQASNDHGGQSSSDSRDQNGDSGDESSLKKSKSL